MPMIKKHLLDIVYADSVCVVVNKPPGLLSVPGRGPGKQDCVVRRLQNLFPQCIEQPAVHRLDMDTSGLMVLGLTKESHRNLSIQFEKRMVAKKYTAVLEGQVEGEQGEVRLSFRLDPDNRPYQVYDPIAGKPGISKWRKVREANGRTWVEFIPLTGRTHQLRLHASHGNGLGRAIVGDRLYGTRRQGQRMLLHASFLEFRQPVDGQLLTMQSEPPF